MIELLLMLLKEDGNVLRNIFKIFLSHSIALFTLHFKHVLIKLLFTITMCCFINFIRTHLELPCFNGVYTFFKL